MQKALLVSAGLMLDKVTYSPGDKSESAMDRYVCIPLLTKTGCGVRCSLVASNIKMTIST
jgi:hypothetical protein